MADYKISLGAEVRTSEIDKQVKNYKGDINVGTVLDTTGITKTLNGFKASPIEIESKLNTQGISDGITNYSSKSNRKTIKVGVDPDFTGVETEIKNHTVNTPLKIKVELNWTGIASEISNFTTTEKIKLNAELNNNAISDSIKSFNDANSSTKIKIGVDPDFDGINEKIKNYIPRTLMKINAKVNKSQIEESIKNFNTSSYVKIGAKLKDGAIESAVTKYVAKEQVPISVDFIAGSTENIDQKINHYKKTPVDISVKLSPAKTGFAAGIKNKPVTIDAILEPESINKVIDGFIPRSKIKVDVSLIPKDINAEVRKLPNPTEPINVKVKLNTENINNDIALIKPITKVGVGTDLILEDVDDQIRAYVPQAKIKVNLDLNDENINSEIGKQGSQNPIQVNVKLDRENINEQIKNFKTQTKIKVGVKLDFASHKDDSGKEIQKGISKQIKDFETKTKVKVGVELDRDSVNTTVQNFKADTPIKLGVELDTEPAEKRIEELKAEFKKFGNININFVGNEDSSKTNPKAGSGVVNNGTNSGINGNIQNAAKDFDAFTAAATKAQNIVKSASVALGELGVDLSQTNADAVTKDLEEMGIEIKKVVTTISGNTLKMSITGIQETEDGIRRVVTRAKEFADVINNPENIRESFTQTFKTSADVAKEEAAEVSAIFKEIKDTKKLIGDEEVKLIGATANGDLAKIKEANEEIKRLKANLEALKKDGYYFDADNGVYGDKFTDEQNAALEGQKALIEHRKKEAQARVSDKAAKKAEKDEAKEINDAYNQIYNIKKRIGDLEVDLIGAEAKKDTETIKSINDEIARLKGNLDTLNKNGVYSSQFSDEQKTSLEELNKQIEYRKKHSQSQVADKTALKETEADFQRLKSLAQEISRLDIKIAGLDADKNKQEIAELITQLNRLEAEYNDLFDITENNLSASQIDELAQDIANSSSKVASTKARVADKADAQRVKEKVKETEQDFNKLKALGKEISNIDIKIAGLDTDKNKQEIEALISTLNRLEAEYNDLFDATERRLTSSQIDELAQDVANGSERIDVVKARVADKADAQRVKEKVKEINDAYNQIYNTRKRIGNLEVDLIGSEAKGDLKAVKDINDEIARLKSNLATLEQNNIGAKFTDEQKSSLKELRKQNQYNKRQAQNSADYKAGIQADKDEARIVNDTYNQIYNIKKKIGSLEVDLIGAEDTNDAKNLRSEIERLKNELLALDKDDVGSKFTEKQKKSLDNLEKQIEFNKRQAENKADIKLGAQIDKEDAARAKQEAKELKESFEKLKHLATEMGKIDVELAGLTDIDKDVDKFNSLKRVAEELVVEFEVLYEKIGRNLDTDQIKELDSIFAKTTGAVRELNNEMAKSNEASELSSTIERLKSVTKEIADLNIDIFKFEDADNIEKALNRLGELENEATELRNALQQKFNITSFDEVDDIARKGKESLDDLIAKAKEAKAELTANVKDSINSGDLQREVNNVRESFNLLRIENKDVEDDIKRLQTLLGNMDSSSDVESVTNDYKEFSQLLETVKNNVRELQREQNNSSESLDLKKESAMMKLNNLFEEGSQAAKKFGTRARELAKELNECGNANIDNVTRKISNLGEEVKKSGLQTKTLTTRLKEQFSKYSSYLSIASVFMYAEQAMRSMFEQVKLIDSAMTELKKVTNETDASYNKFLSNAASRAKELGTTIDGLVASTADFARLGYGFEDAQGLAEVANIYAVVGDEIEGVEDATQSLVSTLAAFKKEMGNMSDTDFAMSIVDKMNEVANNYAISSGGIGEALQRSASSMAAANNSLDETIALITAANEVAQNPEKVGNAMKTKFLYHCLNVQKCA